MDQGIQGTGARARVHRVQVLSALRTTALVQQFETRREPVLSAAWERLAELVDAAAGDGRIQVQTARRLAAGEDLLARVRFAWDQLAADVARELSVAEGDAERTGSRVLARCARSERALWSARTDSVGAQLDLLADLEVRRG